MHILKEFLDDMENCDPIMKKLCNKNKQTERESFT